MSFINNKITMISNSVSCSLPGRTSEQYRNQLGQYGVTGELGTRPVSSLSGGQKSRVAFAVMSMTKYVHKC